MLVEVTDEPVQVISRAAAIDVAKASGMVCMRLPHESRVGRGGFSKVWEVTATFASVVELMDHLKRRTRGPRTAGPYRSSPVQSFGCLPSFNHSLGVARAAVDFIPAMT